MRILLVEDDRIICATLRDALIEAGYEVTACGDGVVAKRMAEMEAFDIVVTDVRLPGLSGIELFHWLRQAQRDVAVVVMTAFATIDDAVGVMRAGGKDYIAKPFEIDELLLRLARIRQEIEFRAQLAAPQSGTSGVTRAIRGDAPATRRLRERVALAAASEATVLITGETGTGKDLCAETIHQQGRRAARPFIAVNCAAIPEALFEAELFGVERGAFTGADHRRAGRFLVADGGTLFLDEIGEMPIASQIKLLRAIETGRFEPLGSATSVQVDVRIIAATNRDLEAEVRRGTFRKDLYYRLNVIDIRTPPLRERRGDIALLAGEFLVEMAARQKRAVPSLDPAAIAALTTHDFPGNIRELIHALERALALAPGDVIGLEHLPEEIIAAAPDSLPPAATESGGTVEPLAEAVARFERQYIQRVVAREGGHRGRAAASLGISRKSLWEKLREHG